MNDRERQFERETATFPEAVKGHLRTIPGNGGKLSAAQCTKLLKLSGMDLEGLMVRLLPIAKLYAISPISHFQVGAVVRAREKVGAGEDALYLGANIEFTGQALSQTVHAEQAATMNAWMDDAVELQAIAVSAAPCGYCRQFLYEFERSNSLVIVTPAPGSRGFNTGLLTEHLPKAFGPLDLKNETRLMATSNGQRSLTLRAASDDPLVLKALSAANQSYAPYTNNLAGCAIQVSDGRLYTGRYAENAAFNPGLSPLQVAISCMNMGKLSALQKITRVVLVEKPTGSGHQGVTELLLRTCAPDVNLEYFEAE